MTNSQLNQLSLSELRDLNKRVQEIYSLKLKMECMVNAETLKVGTTVRYIGGKNKIKNETFILEKINNVNAVCKSNITGTRWNIKLANIEPCDLLEAMDNYEPESGFQS